MKVHVESNYLVSEQVAVIEGVTCIMVRCNDFDHFKHLPEVVSYEGVKCGKTGWNSDSNRACYQSSAHIVMRGK